MEKGVNISPFGFLNINKPKGMTSHDVVSKLRKILNTKQIGHTGTLDPFATGVLPIAVGKATKLIEYLPDDKEYIATVQFGKNTTTYDLEGEVTENFTNIVEKEDVLTALIQFSGEISQIPPIYSAIKKNGKKLYEYARAGESVEISPRKVTIYKTELIDFDGEKQVAKVLVACSSGTYIRSIAYDLGKSLNSGAYLVDLVRTKAGMFEINNSIDLDNLTDEIAKSNMISPVEVANIPVCELNDDEAKRISHGMAIANKCYKNSDIVFLVYGGKIHGVGLVAENEILAKKVFEVL